jgi:hypothetical protein
MWSTGMHKHATRIVTSCDMPFASFVKLNGKRIKICSGTLHGTVYSGHPTRTTFGNSVRVYLYTDYIMHRAGIKDYKIWVCGDDMLMVMERADVEAFTREFWNVYSESKEGVHGLG